jgi:hypothetical protein
MGETARVGAEATDVIAIVSIRNDRRTTVGTLRLVDGAVMLANFDRRYRWVRDFRCFVTPDGRPERPLTIEDGERWLRALPYNLRGSYVWAEEMATPPSPSPPPQRSLF